MSATAVIEPRQPCAEYAGTRARPHRWQAVIKASDHGHVLWRGAEIHAAAITAQVEAEEQLRREQELPL